jgi:hypothetical protein
MVRRGVVICLVGVLLAGPWACCCTAARLVASLRTASSAAVGAPTQQECPPCCRHHAGREPGDASPCCPAPAHHPDSPGCPCKHADRETAVAPVTDKAGAGVLQPTLGPLLALPGETVALVVSPAAAVTLPFWTAGDLIRHCHLLRC